VGGAIQAAKWVEYKGNPLYRGAKLAPPPSRGRRPEAGGGFGKTSSVEFGTWMPADWGREVRRRHIGRTVAAFALS